MWYKKEWCGELLSQQCRPQQALAEYAQNFSSVEGNTTFYGVPDLSTAEVWRRSVPEDFRFVFKLPKQLSHDALLANYQQAPVYDQFLAFCEVLSERLGLVFIQLPAEFSYSYLDRLDGFLQQLPRWVQTCVEVRSMDLFNKAFEEQQLLRMLARHESNRVMFDTRGLFNDTVASAAIIDGRQKKPRVPLHVVATGPNPVVRYIGYEGIEDNADYWQQWQSRLSSWVSDSLSPYFFMHSADNVHSAQLVRRFAHPLRNTLAGAVVPEAFTGEVEASRQQGLF